MYIMWAALSNLAWFINSIIWDGNFVDWAPVWCDITIRLVLAVNIAIPATALCIQRRLYYIISDPVVTATREDKRRSMIVDLLIGVGLPLVNVILAYVVQSRRYDIFEDFGCYPVIINTALSVVLISTWPIAIGLVTGVYCSMNIYHFWIKRRSIRSILASSTGTISVSLYLRLMILSAINLLCTIPLASWDLWTSVALAPVVPYPGFNAVHESFSSVEQIPAALWENDFTARSGMEVSRWSSVICAFIFFIFFGFADEARKHYTQAWQTVVKMVGNSRATESSNSYGSGSQRPFSLRPKQSPLPSDSFVLPVFSSGEPPSPYSDKRSPFGLSYSQNKSSYTVSNNSDSESKYESESSPITPQAPAMAFTLP